MLRNYQFAKRVRYRDITSMNEACAAYQATEKRKTLNLPSNSLRPIKEIWLMMNVNTSRRRLHSSNVWGSKNLYKSGRLLIHCCWTASMEQPTSPSIWLWTYSARIPFGHSREDWLPSINLLSRILTQWNTSFHLLYPSPDFISFCVIPPPF